MSHVAHAGLKFAMYLNLSSRLALNSQFSCILPSKFWDYKQVPPCPAILGFIINPTVRHKPAPLVASVSLAKIVSTEALEAYQAAAALSRIKKGLALCRHVQVPGQLGVTGSRLVSSTESSLRKWRYSVGYRPSWLCRVTGQKNTPPKSDRIPLGSDDLH